MILVSNKYQYFIAGEDVQNLSVCKIDAGQVVNLMPENVYESQRLVLIYNEAEPWEDKNITKIIKGSMCRCQKVSIIDDED